MTLRAMTVGLCTLIAGGALITGAPSPSSGNERLPLPEARAQRAQGLALTFRSMATDAKGKSDTRPSRLVALYVPEAQPPTPFLPAGPFQATWNGSLRLKLRGTYTFTASGRGKLTVSLNDAIVLKADGEDFSRVAGKPVSLNKRNTLKVVYDSPQKGDARVRLYWSAKDFRPEPVPPTVLQHDASADPVRYGQRLRDGRSLLVSLRCMKCHQADTEKWHKAGGMPELAMDAPSLAEVGGRLQQEWLARWIQDPQSLRPTATMPRMLPDAPKGLEAKIDPRALDLSAYLASLGKANGKAKKPPKKQIEEGTRLFGELGCIGCHTPPGTDPEEEDDFDRIPLRDVVAKWQPPALQAFLQDPDKHYTWIRMPDFHLTPTEAGALTAFLTSVEKRPLVPKPLGAGNVDKGRKLAESMGCAQCHNLGETVKNTLMASPLADLKKEGWNKGCMAAEDSARGKAPQYILEEEQRTALLDMFLHGMPSLQKHVPLEAASRRVEALRCVACHRKDGEEDYWTELESEVEDLVSDLPEREKKPEGLAMVQIRPQLTWAGEKLQPQWMEKLFADKLTYKPRPFLSARMPAFPHSAQYLAQGLAAQHGYAPKAPELPKPKAELAKVGQLLVTPSKWNCVGCHDIGSSRAVGVFEAPGVNFDKVRERLQPEYFERWMWSPTRIWPGTKMPTVYQWGLPSPLDDVLGGDASRQIDALWNYFLQGREIVPPK